MTRILHIETSTDVCSVALSEDGVCSYEKVNAEGMNHAKLLAPYIEEVLHSCNQQIDAVAVSEGPGSYTGLRIGVSMAKGLCYGLNIPLIAVPTLATIAQGALSQIPKDESDFLLCPMIDARRMEVYAAFYDSKLQEVHAASADIINEQSYADILSKQKVYFCGNGAPKCMPSFNTPNAILIEDITPLAKNMIANANVRFAQNQFEDVAYFEPFYLKEFQTTTPKNKVI